MSAAKSLEHDRPNCCQAHLAAIRNQSAAERENRSHAKTGNKGHAGEIEHHKLGALRGEPQKIRFKGLKSDGALSFYVDDHRLGQRLDLNVHWFC
jgi:hypothetical protein